MTHASKAPLHRATTQTEGRLVRAALLRSSFQALENAGSVEELASRCPQTPQLSFGLERLSAHREILARRAGNVALAAETTAEELRDLKDAIRRLIGVQGCVVRRVGVDSRMS